MRRGDLDPQRCERRHLRNGRAKELAGSRKGRARRIMREVGALVRRILRIESVDATRRKAWIAQQWGGGSRHGDLGLQRCERRHLETTTGWTGRANGLRGERMGATGQVRGGALPTSRGREEPSSRCCHLRRREHWLGGRVADRGQVATWSTRCIGRAELVTVLARRKRSSDTGHLRRTHCEQSG